MVGWIKVRVDLLQDARVLLIAERLGVLPVAVQGACVALWQWGDSQTADGLIRHATPKMLDARVGIDGFSREMAAVGWLIINDDGLTIPRHDEHNGQSAKARAQSADRMAASRRRRNATNDPCCAPSATRAQRERNQRREDEEKIVPSERIHAADAADAHTEGAGSPLTGSEGPDPTPGPPKGARTRETGTTGRTRATPGEYSDDFSAWWSAYPVTGGASIGSKATAFAAWKKLDDDDRAAALAGLDLYAEQLKAARQRGFNQNSCHASTWLSQRRWDTAGGRPIDTPTARKARSIADEHDAGFGNPTP
jgi:hypothetical protein